jgi:hypothetical protein
MKTGSRRLVLFAIVSVALASAGWWQFLRHDAPEGQRPLVTLDATSIASLKDDFNAGADAARVIVLLAPT